MSIKKPVYPLKEFLSDPVIPIGENTDGEILTNLQTLLGLGEPPQIGEVLDVGKKWPPLTIPSGVPGEAPVVIAHEPVLGREPPQTAREAYFPPLAKRDVISNITKAFPGVDIPEALRTGSLKPEEVMNLGTWLLPLGKIGKAIEPEIKAGVKAVAPAVRTGVEAAIKTSKDVLVGEEGVFKPLLIFQKRLKTKADFDEFGDIPAPKGYTHQLTRDIGYFVPKDMLRKDIAQVLKEAKSNSLHAAQEGKIRLFSTLDDLYKGEGGFAKLGVGLEGGIPPKIPTGIPPEKTISKEISEIFPKELLPKEGEGLLTGVPKPSVKLPATDLSEQIWPRVKSGKDMLREHFRDSLLSKTLQFGAKAPILKETIRSLAGPQTVTRDPIEQSLIIWQKIKDIGDSSIGPILARMPDTGVVPMYEDLLKLAAENGIPRRLVKAPIPAALLKIADPRDVLTNVSSNVYREIANARLKEALSPHATTLKRIPPLQRINIRTFNGNAYPEDIAKQVNEFIGDTANAWLQALSDVQGFVRTLGTQGDLGTSMIQGQLVAGLRPEQWARATATHVLAALDPQVQNNVYRQHAPAIKEMLENSVQTFNLEGLEKKEAVLQSVHAITSLIQKSAELGPSIGPSTKGSLMNKIVTGNINKLTEEEVRRLGAAFHTLLDSSAIFLWESMSPIWKRRGESLVSLGELINHSRGMMSLRGMGIGANQVAVEGGLLSYAGQYRRSSAAFFFDALQGGAKGTEARNAYAKLLGGQTMAMSAYLLAAVAMGWITYEEMVDRFTPIKNGRYNSTFFTIPIGDVNVGFGGQTHAMMRLLGKMSIMSATDPEVIFDPRKPEFWDSSDNPLTGYIRANLPIGPSLLADIVAGRTYLGQPIDGAMGFAQAESKRLLFMWVDSFMNDYPLEDQAKLAGSQFFGLRSFPSNLSTLRDQIVQDTPGLSATHWTELTPKERAQLKRTPKIQAIQKRTEKLYGSTPFTQYEHLGEEEYVNRENLGKSAERGYSLSSSGQKIPYSLDQYKEDIGKSYAIVANERKKLEADPDFQKAIVKKTEKSTDNDKALTAYYDLYKAYTLPDKRLNPDVFDAREQFLAALPTKEREYVESQVGINRTPFEEKIQALNKIVRPYFDVEKNIARLFPQYQRLYDQRRLAFGDNNNERDSWILDQLRDQKSRNNIRALMEEYDDAVDIKRAKILEDNPAMAEALDQLQIKDIPTERLLRLQRNYSDAYARGDSSAMGAIAGQATKLRKQFPKTLVSNMNFP